MPEDPLPYAADPNRVVSSGAETLDGVGLGFTVTAERIEMEIRTGPINERTVSLEYDEIERAEFVQDVSPGIRLVTDRTEYTVTNVAPSSAEVRRVVQAIRARADSSAEGPSAARSRSRKGAEHVANSTDGGHEELALGQDEDDGEDGPQRVGPSEVLNCPLCGGRTAVPDGIPDEQQEARCPKCGDVIGYIHATGEYIVVDPDAEIDS